jgi:hypothetical protein
MVPNPVVSRTCSSESMGNSSANTSERRLSHASKKAERCINANTTPYLTVIIIARQTRSVVGLAVRVPVLPL